VGVRRACLVAAIAALLVAVPLAASATNGYFAHGVGIKAKGMGGATLAVPQDALAGGNNPAAVAFLGDRFDIGVDWFRPDRGSEIVGNDLGGGMTADGPYDANDTEAFYVPEIGVTKALSNRVALGLSVYGNGGMNTSYTTPIPLFDNPMDGAVNAGVDLMQAFIVPTVAVKLNDQHALGLGVNVAWQRFEATGLANFKAATSDTNALTDNDYSTSVGFGARIGWLGKLTDAVSVAAAYQSRTFMGEFEEYAGLFAEQGGFDIPSSFHGGIAVAPAPGAVIAVDVSHIMYSEVKSIANPLLPNFGQALLGTDEGAGFGWEDVTAFKVGVAYDVIADLTLRAGYNYGAQPIPESETLFNILAPGVVETHVTLGGTWRITPSAEISFAYVKALENTIEGVDSIPASYGGGEANLTMSQDSFGIGFGMIY
jgi:long-chain fatty acid transport protein